ncbi:hypothetical protein [Acinetobacter junii]|jgi:hypothetical protein|uniref:hypothetical protein n=1 Tax=Acinetobacter junii TaxID=40215 RepID=UPI00095096E1|nr:hypothetical protein [Acinetobacter junii]APU48426.1 hypothetical protein BVL33_07915 [Acinetobacter junii]
MAIIRIQDCFVQEQNRKATVNFLIAQCIKEACANTPNLRQVLVGDMQSKVLQTRLRKAG